MKKYVLAITVLIFLYGCEETYRYPCQDPKNIDAEECKPKICEVTRFCIKPKEHK